VDRNGPLRSGCDRDVVRSRGNLLLLPDRAQHVCGTANRACPAGYKFRTARRTVHHGRADAGHRCVSRASAEAGARIVIEMKKLTAETQKRSWRSRYSWKPYLNILFSYR